MILPLSLLIGLRFGHGSRRSSMVSLIYLISIICIVLGVAVMIISLSVMNGFKYELNNRILAAVPHGEIKPVIQPWDNWNNVLIKVEKLPGIVTVNPYISFTGLVESRNNICIIQINGVNPQQEVNLVGILSKFTHDNAWLEFMDGKNQIIIGNGIAEALKVKQGDWISIIIPKDNSYHKLQQPKRVRLHVIGIFQLNSQFDHSLAIVPLSDAQQYLDMGDSVTGIAIRVNDVFKINKLLFNVSKIIKNYVYIESWISKYGYIYRDIQMIRTIMYLLMVILISLACFNIVSTLVIAVKEKSSDIAILRTLGAKNNLIRAIFIWYGLLVGFFGSTCGTIIGIIVSSQLTYIIKKIESIIGHQFLSSKIYFIDFLPSKLYWPDVAYVLITVFLLSLLASWYPANRASYIDPVKVLSIH